MRKGYQEYQQWIYKNKRNCGDGSLMIPENIIHSLEEDPVLDILHLTILMDFQCKHRSQAEQLDHGWFSCSIKDLQEHYGDHLVPPAVQTRFLNRLELSGHIKRKVKGRPPQRWLWIDFNKLYKESLFPE